MLVSVLTSLVLFTKRHPTGPEAGSSAKNVDGSPDNSMAVTDIATMKSCFNQNRFVKELRGFGENIREKKLDHEFYKFLKDKKRVKDLSKVLLKIHSEITLLSSSLPELYALLSRGDEAEIDHEKEKYKKNIRK